MSELEQVKNSRERCRPGWAHSRWSAARVWFAGFSFESWCLALQTAVALALAMLFAVIEPLWLALDQSAVWIVVTTAVVLEPTLGATVKKTALRVVGTILAGVAGLAILYLAGAGAGGFSYTLHPTAMAGVVTAFTAAAGALFMLLKLRYGAIEYCFTVVLITIPVVIVPGLRSKDGVEVDTTFKRIAAILIGVGIAAAVQTLLLPVLGRRQLACRMAGALREAAALLVELVGILAGEAEPDSAGGVDLGSGPPQGAPCLDGKKGADDGCSAGAGAGDARASLPGAGGPPARAVQLAGDSVLRRLGAQLERRQLLQRSCRLDSLAAGFEKALPLAALELRLLGRPHRFPAALFSQLRQRLVVVAGLQVNMAAALTAAAELEVVQLAAQPGTQPESHRSSPGSSTGGSIASMVGAACVGAAADGFGSGECMSAVSERYRNWNEELEGVQRALVLASRRLACTLRLLSDQLPAAECHAPAGARRAAQLQQHAAQRRQELAALQGVVQQLAVLQVRPLGLSSAEEGLAVSGLAVASGCLLLLARQGLAMLAMLDTADAAEAQAVIEAGATQDCGETACKAAAAV